MVMPRFVELYRVDQQLMLVNPERVIIMAPVDELTTELYFAPNFAIRVRGNYKAVAKTLEGQEGLIKP